MGGIESHQPDVEVRRRASLSRKEQDPVGGDMQHEVGDPAGFVDRAGHDGEIEAEVRVELREKMGRLDRPLPRLLGAEPHELPPPGEAGADFLHPELDGMGPAVGRPSGA